MSRSLGGAPVMVMNQQVQRETGRKAQLSNIAAGRAVYGAGCALAAVAEREAAARIARAMVSVGGRGGSARSRPCGTLEARSPTPARRARGGRHNSRQSNSIEYINYASQIADDPVRIAKTIARHRNALGRVGRPGALALLATLWIRTPAKKNSPVAADGIDLARRCRI